MRRVICLRGNNISREQLHVICPLMKGNNMLSALAKYVINRLIHGLFHIALVISPRLVSSLGADIKVSC
jgi:hypothetical protein